MRANDILSGAVLAALGLFFVYSGHDLGLGRISDPGSGFVIFWVGWILTGLSLAVAFVAFGTASDGGLAAVWAGANWRKVGFVVMVLALHAWLMPLLGFIVATLVLLAVLFRSVEPQPWRVVLVGSALSTGAAWLLFAKALGTQLPTGLFGIG